MNAYDEYGCCVSCGYSWCDILEKCIRVWETECISHRQLNKLDEFNLTELGVFIAGVCASIGGMLVIIQKSKCEEINCCCLKCKRNIQAILEQEKLELTGHTGSTPRRGSLAEENKKVKQELELELENEPEVEKNI